MLIPQLGSRHFSTGLFERYQRSEQVLLLSMIEMVINKVPTRKIRALVEELCGTEFSWSTVSEWCKKLNLVFHEWNKRSLAHQEHPFRLVDALVLRVWKDGRVRLFGALIATGINWEGYREILGLRIGDSESETS